MPGSVPGKSRNRNSRPVLQACFSLFVEKPFLSGNDVPENTTGPDSPQWQENICVLSE